MSTATTASSNPGAGRPNIGWPVVAGRGRLRPLRLTEVEVTGGFWARRQEINAAATLAHFDATRGTLAVELGPLVMCVESVDLPEGRDVGSLWVDPSVAPVAEASSVRIAGYLADEHDGEWPYRSGITGDAGTGESIEVPLIAYHDWANRGPATMRVWLPIAGEPR